MNIIKLVENSLKIIISNLNIKTRMVQMEHEMVA